jgi:hypothetical protein
MAITAWSAKVLSSAWSFSVKALAHDHDGSDSAVLPQHRHPCRREVSHLFVSSTRPGIGFRHVEEVRNVDDAPLAHRPPGGALIHGQGQGAGHRPDDRAAERGRVHQAIVVRDHDPEMLGAEELGAAVEDLLEDRPGVGD